MSSPKWSQNIFTYIWIFNTGRGLSICIRFPHNIGIMYDLGKSDSFSPTEFVNDNIAPHLTQYSKCSIAQCFLSHPHADHIGEIGSIVKDSKQRNLYPALLTCPNDKCDGEKVNFMRIINDENKQLLDIYRNLYSDRTPPLQTLQDSVRCGVPNVEYGFYYMKPPRVDAIHKGSDQDYGNGLSLVLYLRHGNQSLLIPGDITPSVLEQVIEGKTDIEKRYFRFDRPAGGELWHTSTSNQPTLRDLLGVRGLSVLVAPHHGLQSCFSERLFEVMKGTKPMINVISEKRHLSLTDGKVDERYQKESGALGLGVDIEGSVEYRRSVSTRDGHHILLVFRGTDACPKIYLRKNPYDLLSI